MGRQRCLKRVRAACLRRLNRRVCHPGSVSTHINPLLSVGAVIDGSAARLATEHMCGRSRSDPNCPTSRKTGVVPVGKATRAVRSINACSECGGPIGRPSSNSKSSDEAGVRSSESPSRTVGGSVESPAAASRNVRNGRRHKCYLLRVSRGLPTC